MKPASSLSHCAVCETDIEWREYSYSDRPGQRDGDWFHRDNRYQARVKAHRAVPTKPTELDS